MLCWRTKSGVWNLKVKLWRFFGSQINVNPNSEETRSFMRERHLERIMA